MYLGRRKRRVASVAALAAAAVIAAGCSSSGSSAPPGAGGGKPLKGGTVTWAELPSSPANWIFPFMSLAYFSVPNSQEFQYLLYRPLYWFGGENTQPTVDYGLSVASAPVYSNGGKTITINMKGYKWSNGETVDAKDVVFWLHMMYAEYANWAGAGPKSFSIPYSLTSIKIASPNQVVLTLNKAYSSLWYTYNQLSQITPMPMAWDVTKAGAKAGSGGCTADTAADKWAKCKAVYNFLISQAKATSSYTTSPIWTVIDGPWKLQSFNTDGADSFVPNPKYSGSPKPKISVFKEVPFTSDSAEYTALKTGSLSIGYIPSQDLPLKSASQVLPATNPLGSAFKLAPNYDWGFAYYQINFKNPSMGPVFKQLYARQAMEMVADQSGMAKSAWRGYAYPNTGIAPAKPANNPWLGSVQKENGGLGPYPFSTSKAKALLTSHGWSEVGGVMTCQDPAKCGAGIKKGQPFKFTLDYSTGETAFTNEASVYKSDASLAGISVNIVGQTFNTIIGEAVPSNPSWQGSMYGLWIFSPDYLPTGEVLFATGAGSNSGSYSNPTMDKLINDTTTSGSIAVFHNFANYAAEQLPFIYMPLNYGIYATSSKLHGVFFNPIQTELPEYYYLTK
jgi:peptide/nickel transport system substrate-binding protein